MSESAVFDVPEAVKDARLQSQHFWKGAHAWAQASDFGTRQGPRPENLCGNVVTRFGILITDFHDVAGVITFCRNQRSAFRRNG
jgi:hypothetical protein